MGYQPIDPVLITVLALHAMSWTEGMLVQILRKREVVNWFLHLPAQLTTMCKLEIIVEEMETQVPQCMMRGV